MSDFVTELRLQLREAAEREARRGSLRRAARTARVNGTRPALALAAAAVLAVLVFVGAGQLGHKTPTPSGPRLVARVDLATQGGYLASGFGAVWATDPAAGDVLRVAPNSGRVIARIPTGGEPHAIAAGAGAVWTFDFASGRLLRIDPAAGRVTARLPLGLPARGDAGLAVFGAAVWAADHARMLRIDPTGERIMRRVSLRRGGLEAADIATGQGRVFVLGRDGRLVTFDGRTGARVASVPLTPARWLAGAGRYLIAGVEGGVAAFDPADGRRVWERPIAAQSTDVANVFGAALWVHGTDRTGHDGLWRIDANTGRVTGTLRLPEFGASAMARVGDRLWVMSPGGRLQIVSGS